MDISKCKPSFYVYAMQNLRVFSYTNLRIALNLIKVNLDNKITLLKYPLVIFSVHFENQWFTYKECGKIMFFLNFKCICLAIFFLLCNLKIIEFFWSLFHNAPALLNWHSPRVSLNNDHEYIFFKPIDYMMFTNFYYYNRTHPDNWILWSASAIWHCFSALLPSDMLAEHTFYIQKPCG